MKGCQKFIPVSVIYRICIFVLTGCSGHKTSQSILKLDDLSSWVGKYEFGEFAEPNINMGYNITISKEDDDYSANISIDGFQTGTRIKARVQGNQGAIDFVFERYLPDNRFEVYHTGDVLLSFQKKGSDIYTDWGKVEPILKENQASGNIYFIIKCDNKCNN